MQSDGPQPTIRVAAAGDIHCSDENCEQVRAAFSGLQGGTDLVLLAGDLTAHGHPEQAELLADACRGLDVPVVAVLGNHDWHLNRRNELVEVLVEAGVDVLERAWTICDVHGVEVGIVGTKGFIGGFPDSELPDFGEPLLRQVYAYTTDEVDALDEGLGAVAHCALRIVLLHYAPTQTTLDGEPRVIWAFLGSSRLAGPILEHRPDVVFHGHGHLGRFEGSIANVPVFNVATQVTGRDFWTFELAPSSGETPASGKEAGPAAVRATPQQR
jgi:uncharacterized protein